MVTTWSKHGSTQPNDSDDDGNPAGGMVRGVGLFIQWQNGPLGRGDERREPNGAFVETVIAAAKQRIEALTRRASAPVHLENARSCIAS